MLDWPAYSSMRLPIARRAGEGDAVDVHVQRERLARRVAEARHDVEHALRQPGLDRELRDAKRRERRFLGRLQHDGVAGRERRAELPARPSAAGNSTARSRRRRPTGSRVMSASASCAGRRDLVVDLVDRLGDTRRCSGPPPGCRSSCESAIGLPMSSVSSSASSSRCLRISSAKRSSTFLRAAGARRDQWPASKARARARDREFDVGGVAGGDLRDDLAVGRVDAVEGRAGNRGDVLAVDEGLRARRAASCAQSRASRPLSVPGSRRLLLTRSVGSRR